MKELRFGETQRYFVGILEQYKGKTKLLNPDPYAAENKNSNNGIVINDVTPTFASPIVGIVNPNQIKKDRHSSKLFKVNDEVYKAQRQVEQMVAKQRDLIALQKMKLEEQSKKLQKEMEIKKMQALEELKKLQNNIKEQERKNLLSGIGSLFYPELKKGGLLNLEEFKDKKKRA
jgi:hypothetical protein